MGDDILITSRLRAILDDISIPSLIEKDLENQELFAIINKQHDKFPEEFESRFTDYLENMMSYLPFSSGFLNGSYGLYNFRNLYFLLR